MDQFSPADEISQGPEREPRLRLPRWSRPSWAIWVLAGVFAVSSVLVIADLVGGGGSPGGRPSSVAPAASSMVLIAGGGSSFSVTGPPGTSVVNCDEGTLRNLGPNWQADSLRAGPLWLVGAREAGYVRPGGGPGATAATVTRVTAITGRSVTTPSGGAQTTANGSPDNWLMVVHVDPGATVMLRVTAAEAPYFQLTGGEPAGADGPADGGHLLVFPPCQPIGSPAGPGWVVLYNLGFHLAPGGSAAVEVVPFGQTAKPTWLIFTAPS